MGVQERKIAMPRVHLTRIITPLFLCAVCLYTMVILFSYPSLEGSRHRLHALDIGFENDDYVEGYVDRVPRRNMRKEHTRHAEGLARHAKMKVVDKVLMMKKRAASQLKRFGFTKDAKNGDHKLLNDDGKDVKNIPETRVKIEMNKPTYNKDITVPKSKHYVDEPVDAHKYGYIHKPNVCFKSSGRRHKVQLVFMVTTAPKNFDRRMLIRNTYGNKRNWPVINQGTFRTVYLLGAVSNVTLQSLIDVEARTYGDILQEDFVDSYANLTLKTVMGLKWVTNHCRHADFTMKIDDDSMIHQNRMLRLLKNATTANFTAAEALIDAPVLRNTSSKYYISEEYFPAPTYPPYLNGPGYLVSTDLAEGLYRVATSTPLFPWEDVFLGLCLKQLGVTPVVHHDFMLIIAEYSQISNKTEAAQLFRYFTVVSNLEPEYMMLMWDTCHFKMKKT